MILTPVQLKAMRALTANGEVGMARFSGITWRALQIRGLVYGPQHIETGVGGPGYYYRLTELGKQAIIELKEAS